MPPGGSTKKIQDQRQAACAATTAWALLNTPKMASATMEEQDHPTATVSALSAMEMTLDVVRALLHAVAPC